MDFHQVLSTIGKYTLGTVAVLGIIAIAIVSLLRDKIINNQYNSISVTGRGSVSYVPDTAVITAAFTSNSTQPAEKVQQELDAKYKKMAETLAALSSVQNSVTALGMNVNVNPDYSNPSGASRTDASKQFSVTIRQLDSEKKQAQQILSLLSSLGVNQIQGVSYSLSDTTEIRAKAWEKAFAQIEASKKNIEAKTDIRFKDLTNWSENVLTPSGADAYAQGMNVVPGEYALEIYASYRVKETK